MNPFIDDVIPRNYFDFMDKENDISSEDFIEKLARYGDPKNIPLSIPMQKDNSTDISFAGFQAQSINTFIANLDKNNIDFKVCKLLNLYIS